MTETLPQHLETLAAERDKLQAFKDWVHTYLDQHGVPHHPPGTHGAAGCRIGDRMDWLIKRLNESVQRYEDKRLEVHNVCKDRASAERSRDDWKARCEAAEEKWREAEKDVKALLMVSNSEIAAEDKARAQIARLRESLHRCERMLYQKCGGDTEGGEEARDILAETAP